MNAWQAIGRFLRWLDTLSSPPLLAATNETEQCSKPVTETPVVTVDILLVRKVEMKLYVLLIQRGKEPYQGRWALPGGKLASCDETLLGAAYRELREETGITQQMIPVLLQGLAYGDKWRDPRGRYVSVVFYAGPFKHVVEPRAGDDAAAAQWFDVNQLPPLAFDHGIVIQRTLLKLLSPPFPSE